MRSSILPDPKLTEFWIEHALNVLLEGEYGCGKSAYVKEAFNTHLGEQGRDWLYFSAPTLDPWVDLIGVPRIVQEDGVDVLDLIRPKALAFDRVKGVFFDEINRAEPKTINALLELMQFKSINGKKYNNLKIIWAAINPHDEEEKYMVSKLDPAHVDRFHIHYKVKSEPDMGYFLGKFGDYAEPAIKWWTALPPEIKQQVSPRRLDYALEIFSKGGNLRYVLAESSNVGKLTNELRTVDGKNRFGHLIAAKDYKAIKNYLAEPNNFDAQQASILANPELKKICVPLIPRESLGVWISTNLIAPRELSEIEDIGDTITEIVKAGGVTQTKIDELRFYFPEVKVAASKTPANDKKLDPVKHLEQKIASMKEICDNNISTATDRDNTLQALANSAFDFAGPTRNINDYNLVKRIMEQLNRYCGRSRATDISGNGNVKTIVDLCSNTLCNEMEREEDIFEAYKKVFHNQVQLRSIIINIKAPF